jgi:glycerate kinase
MRIVAAPNSFKGCMSSVEAAQAIKTGILAACPDCEVVCVPVSDGGDGLVDVMAQALSGSIMNCNVRGPLMEQMESRYCFVDNKDLAVIEMALASGLALVPEKLHDPTKTTSYGTGELIKAALDKGAAHIVVGLGGSATCDGGIGMASALGYRFLDKKGSELFPKGSSLVQIHSIDSSAVDKRLDKTVFEAVCDVRNPLIGPNGASYVYAPQKGATEEQVEFLDKGLEHLAFVIGKETGVNIQKIPGAGAAGGLGGGMYAFLNAKLRKGIDLVMDIVNLKEKIQGADLVITGEGQIDYQTKYDKAPAGVARVAAEEGIPCIAVCGNVGERIDELYEYGLDAFFTICKGPQSLESSMEDGPQLLSHAVEQVVRTFRVGRFGTD